MSTSITSTLGPRIRKRRHSLGMTQQELGELAGCTKSTISLIERGRTWPSVKLLVRIAEALGERPGYFLDPESKRGHPATPAIVEELKKLVEAWE